MAIQLLNQGYLCTSCQREFPLLDKWLEIQRKLGNVVSGTCVEYCNDLQDFFGTHEECNHE